MATCNVQSLLDDASCFECLPPGLWAVLELQLLCEILAAGGGSGTSGLVGIVDPEGSETAEPGATYFNTANATFWVKGSGSGNTGWVQLL